MGSTNIHHTFQSLAHPVTFHTFSFSLAKHTFFPLLLIFIQHIFQHPTQIHNHLPRPSRKNREIKAGKKVPF